MIGFILFHTHVAFELTVPWEGSHVYLQLKHSAADSTKQYHGVPSQSMHGRTHRTALWILYHYEQEVGRSFACQSCISTSPAVLGLIGISAFRLISAYLSISELLHLRDLPNLISSKINDPQLCGNDGLILFHSSAILELLKRVWSWRLTD